MGAVTIEHLVKPMTSVARIPARKPAKAPSNSRVSDRCCSIDSMRGPSFARLAVPSPSAIRRRLGSLARVPKTRERALLTCPEIFGPSIS
jgi:hypothetical protein